MVAKVKGNHPGHPKGGMENVCPFEENMVEGVRSETDARR